MMSTCFREYESIRMGKICSFLLSAGSSGKASSKICDIAWHITAVILDLSFLPIFFQIQIRFGKLQPYGLPGSKVEYVS